MKGVEIYANLHLHSTHSDGAYTPTETVIAAKEEGYKALAITDHDSATAFPEMKEACEKEGMEYLFGVEFSTLVPNDYHIVGFSFDPEYPEMKQYLADMGERQTDNTRNCFELAVSKGDITGITWKEVLDYSEGVAWICNNHVFRAMKAKGLIDDFRYIEWFNKNFRNQRAMFAPIKDFKPAHDIIKLVKDAGGFSVIAHPNKNLDDIDYLIESGLEGIEVIHPSMMYEIRERAYKIAMERNLYISGGTDHSGYCSGFYSSCPAGMNIRYYRKYLEPCSVGVEERFFRELKNRKLER